MDDLGARLRRATLTVDDRLPRQRTRRSATVSTPPSHQNKGATGKPSPARRSPPPRPATADPNPFGSTSSNPFGNSNTSPTVDSNPFGANSISPADSNPFGDVTQPSDSRSNPFGDSVGSPVATASETPSNDSTTQVEAASPAPTPPTPEELQKKTEMIKKCTEIQSKFLFDKYSPPQIDITKKKFICESPKAAEMGVAKKGAFGRMKEAPLLPRHLFLFDDLLVVTEAREEKNRKTRGMYAVRKFVHLAVAGLFDLRWTTSGEKADALLNCRSIKMTDPLSNPRECNLIFESTDTQKEWICKIADAMLALKPEELRLSQMGFRHTVINGTLFSAVLQGRQDMIADCLSGDVASRANINEYDVYGYNALHYALSTSNLEVTQQLLEFKADPTSKQRMTGIPALYMAVDKVSEHTVRMLLDAKASPLQAAFKPAFSPEGVKDVEQPHALALAAIKYCGKLLPGSRWTILRNLLEAVPSIAELNQGANLVEQVLSIETYGAEQVLEMLLRYGYKSNFARKSDGATGLHILCAKAKPHAKLKMLLGSGAYPNVLDASGDTALHVLLRRTKSVTQRETRMETKAAIEVLLSTGARIDIKSNKDGVTAAKLLQNDEEMHAFAVHCTKRYLTLKQPGSALHWAEVLDRRMLGITATEWSKDDDDKSDCPLCGHSFSMFFRRHHCRFCLTLCCNLCSSKTFLLVTGDDVKEKEECRVCDGCFNFMRSRCQIFEQRKNTLFVEFVRSRPDWTRAATSIQFLGNPDRCPPSLPTRSTNDSNSGNRLHSHKDQRQKLFAGARSSSKNPSRDNKGDKTRNHVTAVHRQMDKNLQKLHERGERLNELQRATRDLGNNSRNFAQAAKALKEKQKKGFLGLF